MSSLARRTHLAMTAMSQILSKGVASLNELAEAAIRRYQEHSDTRTVTVRCPKEAERLNTLFQQAGVPLQAEVLDEAR